MFHVNAFVSVDVCKHIGRADRNITCSEEDPDDYGRRPLTRRASNSVLGWPAEARMVALQGARIETPIGTIALG